MEHDMYRSPRRWLAVGVTIVAATSLGSHVDARSGATITASFADSCRDVAVHASKDVSHVVIRYTDGREVKDETIDSPDYAIDGGPGDEIASLTVKASVNRETFQCTQAFSPPVALLESRRCAFGLCTDWTSLDSDGSHERCSHRDDRIPYRGTGSTDLDGDIATWTIDFGDGSSASGSWPTSPPVDVGHTFANPPVSGLVTVTLTLTDATGLADSDTIVVCLADFTPD
jgi:hypothetical protein